MWERSRLRMEDEDLEISFDFQTKAAFNHWIKINIRWNLSSTTWIWVVSKNQVDQPNQRLNDQSFFSKFGLEHKSRLSDWCFDSSESMEYSSGSFLISRLSQLVDQAANDLLCRRFRHVKRIPRSVDYDTYRDVSDSREDGAGKTRFLKKLST